MRNREQESSTLRAVLDASDALNKAVSVAWSVNDDLIDLASSLRRIGMIQLSDELLHIAPRALEAIREARSLESARLSSTIQEQEKAFGENIKAILEHVAKVK